MHTVVRPPWGRRFTCRYPGGWIAETTLRLRVAGAPCGRYFQASRGDGIRVRMAGLARGRAAPLRRRDPGAGVLAAERGGGVRAGGGGAAGGGPGSCLPRADSPRPRALPARGPPPPPSNPPAPPPP